MSLLHDMQAAAINPETSVTDLLRMCMILASRLENKELLKWVNQELNGYEPLTDLPSYRIVKCGSFGNFANGHAVWSNLQISAFGVPNDFHSYIDTMYFRQGLEALTYMVEHAKKDSIKFAWDKEVAFVVGKCNYPNWQCLDAYRLVSVGVIAAIIDTIKTRILDFVLEIEKEDPNIGEPLSKIPLISKEQVTNIFHQKIMINSVGSFEQGGSKMSEGTTFNVGSQLAGRDINQAGRDIYQAAGDLKINPSSSATDVRNVVRAIQCKINESDIGEKNRQCAEFSVKSWPRIHNHLLLYHR
jgi:hypothetical protein